MVNPIFKHKPLKKKGAITDAIPVMILIFVFGIVATVSYVMYQGLVSNGLFTIADSPNAARLQQAGENAFDIMDVMSILVFVGTTIAAIVGALLIRSHPAFFFISIIVMLVQIVVGVALGNTWEEFITNPALDSQGGDVEAQFSITNFFLSNLPVLVLVVLILLAIILYAINPFGIE